MIDKEKIRQDIKHIHLMLESLRIAKETPLIHEGTKSLFSSIYEGISMAADSIDRELDFDDKYTRPVKMSEL